MNGPADDKELPACGFIPFSDGPRSCVGQSLALLELRVVLAALYSNFTFRLHEDITVKEAVSSATYAVTLKPNSMVMHHKARRGVCHAVRGGNLTQGPWHGSLHQPGSVRHMLRRTPEARAWGRSVGTPSTRMLHGALH